MSIDLKPAKARLYTVVDESFEVAVYRTLKSVSDSLAVECLCLENQTKVASASDIAAALRKNWSVRLYPQSGGDWQFKIEKHTRLD